ncbi:hypothetical protein RRG08_007428, partial [Elysia crispata]
MESASKRCIQEPGVWEGGELKISFAATRHWLKCREMLVNFFSATICSVLGLETPLVKITDASGKFVVVDVGSCGGNSDGGVFSRSSLGKKLMSDKLSIPQRGYIP